eukprot:gnl/Carplike_NY0171/9098_a12667_175.p1 GENE.gnl/Carplike_NY0171/9098_a12667_175~~gnl/Carplike_NY0171/9098_a12667_175.p1  ORF type:complete len:210 (+),score=23.92 gnl/Carplike_NY0171/9098_a12667_175:32-661(+)
MDKKYFSEIDSLISDLIFRIEQILLPSAQATQSSREELGQYISPCDQSYLASFSARLARLSLPFVLFFPCSDIFSTHKASILVRKIWKGIISVRKLLKEAKIRDIFKEGENIHKNIAQIIKMIQKDVKRSKKHDLGYSRKKTIKSKECWFEEKMIRDIVMNKEKLNLVWDKLFYLQNGQNGVSNIQIECDNARNPENLWKMFAGWVPWI